jgi:hypothetical protein
MLQIENRAFPEICLGTSPFLGAGQFNDRAMMYYSRLYKKPENMVKIIVRSIELGINGIQAIAYGEIIKAITKSVEITGEHLYSSLVIGLNSWREELNYAETIGSDIIYIHAQISDSQNLPLIGEVVDTIRQRGLVPGCATHQPARTIPFLDNSNLPIASYLAPINKTGRFMGNNPERTREIISHTPKVIVAKKTLAAGRLKPREALEYFRDLKWVAGIAIGIASVQEADETFPIAREIFGT